MLKTGTKRAIRLAGLLLLVAAYPLAAQASLLWTERNPSADSTGQPDLTQVIYAGGQYIAVGGGTILQSADGVTWNTVYQDLGVDEVAYGNGVYVAGGSAYVDDGTGQGILVQEGTWATSKDGVHWTRLNHSAPGSEIVFAGGQFTVVGSTCGEDDGVQIQPGATFPCIATGIDTSSDGVTWVSHKSTAAGAPFVPTTLGFVAGRFVSISVSKQLETAFVSSDAVNWESVATLQLNLDVFGFDRIRTIGDTARAFEDQGYPLMATTQDGYTWHMAGYLFRDQHFADMAAYGDEVLAPVVKSFQMKDLGYSMWLSTADQEWCPLDGYPTSVHGSALAVNGGQVVVVGTKGEIFSTPPAASAETLSCAVGSEPVQPELTEDSVPINHGGKGGTDLFVVMGLLGLAGLRQRGWSRAG